MFQIQHIEPIQSVVFKSQNLSIFIENLYIEPIQSVVFKSHRVALKQTHPYNIEPIQSVVFKCSFEFEVNINRFN